MDFKSEIEQHAQLTQTQMDSALQDIQKLVDTIVRLNDEIIRLRGEINTLDELNKPFITTLTEKEEFIAQLNEALLGHKSKLAANKELLATYTKIKESQADIERHLQVLEAQKTRISDEISTFHVTHPYIGPTYKGKLDLDLSILQNSLQTVIENIERLASLEIQLNSVVKFFLQLFTRVGWRTDPLADEQKKLKSLSQELGEITEHIEQFDRESGQLYELKSQEQDVILTSKTILQEKEILTQKEEIDKAISESEKTIESLEQTIKLAQKDCKALKRQINTKTLDINKASLEKLLTEMKDMKSLENEKTLVLSEVHNPSRIALKTAFITSLLKILDNQTQYTQQKNTRIPKLFKPTPADTGVNSTPNNIALTRIQLAIKHYQQGIAKSSSEHHLLSQVTSKLLIWQMKENIADLSLSFSSRQEAYQSVSSELSKLIAQLPFDNPLHGAEHYILSLTAPVDPEPSLSSGQKPGKR